jgi:hydroxymethylbilane synthase
MAKTPRLRIGTRGSPLALAQAHLVRDRLAAAHADLADAVEVVVIKTTGDRVQDRTLAEIGGKGLFTKEIEQALIDGGIDLAVHSMKDVPTWLPDGLAIACVLPREDPRDAFIARDGMQRLADLPDGAVVGTASLRRQAQLRHNRPDLQVVPLRGNVETRLRKLGDGQVDATLLALAGLKRLAMADRATAVLEPEEMLPAVAQGAIGIEVRTDDKSTRDRLAPLDDARTATEVAAERALLAVLDGSCRTPIAALARVDDGALALDALVAMPDGSELWRTRRHGTAADAVALGRDAGEELHRTAGARVFAALE